MLGKLRRWIRDIRAMYVARRHGPRLMRVVVRLLMRDGHYECAEWVADICVRAGVQL